MKYQYLTISYLTTPEEISIEAGSGKFPLTANCSCLPLKSPVEILCRIGDNLPAQVKCDPHRFRQVLVNLMGNAAKFTDRGEIELSLDVKEEQDGRVMIHTKVRDTGIGIAEKNLEHIFDLFQQADGSTTRKYGGSGLGLSIGRKIANLMGGDVWAESELGKGS